MNADRSDGPFATLERARDEIRALKRSGRLPSQGVVVELHGGRHVRSAPFVLTSEDAGTADGPIWYRAVAEREVRIVGGPELDGLEPVRDASLLERLDPAARPHVVELDLRRVGIQDFGGAGGGGLEVFVGDRPLTLARWPNTGFVQVDQVLGARPHAVRGRRGVRDGVFSFQGERWRRWLLERDVWVHGYWFWDWSESRHRVSSVDPERGALTVEAPEHTYGYRAGQDFYVYNALSELDRPGEWYLDRERGLLVIWPSTAAPVVVSVAEQLVVVRDASHVRFSGLIFEAARGDALTIEGGHDVRVEESVIRNVGGWGVRILGGERHAILDCEVVDTGLGGVELTGGDRPTLTPAKHLVSNSHIHRYGRWRPTGYAAVSMSGVGLEVSQNLIHDGPFQAIAFSGNEHLIELNEIHDVGAGSDDVGAIYGGRDWTMRGTLIRHNYLHDIRGRRGIQAAGVYLDDMLSGITVYGNIFDRITRAVVIGGGRHNEVSNNIFVDCEIALVLDARGMGWAKDAIDEVMIPRWRQMPVASQRWVARYPTLHELLELDPAQPIGNAVIRNIFWESGMHGVEPRARPLLRFEQNWVNEDPGFEGHLRPRFELRSDSPAVLGGFERIPRERIGRRGSR